MTPAEIASIINSTGVPIAALLLLFWFLVVKFWPWWIEQRKIQQANEQERHKEYLKEFTRGNDIAERVTQLVQAFIDATAKNHSEILTKADHNQEVLISRMDNHHEQTMKALETITNLVSRER